MKIIHPIYLLLFLIACQPSSNTDQKESQREVKAAKDSSKVYNLMGEELSEKQLSADTRIKFENNLAEAKAVFDANPDSLEAIIWYGRRLAYLGRYLESIDVYSQGLAIFPNSYHLRRHRGHRFISTRQLNKAIEDFEMAAFYSLNAENAIEPDGLPNRLNQPLGNDKFNIWYHYGLAHYLSGRFDKAISAYKKCMEFSDNDDLLSATSYWLYMTYKKIGNAELADQLLDNIHNKMTIIENDAYLDLLLLFKGELNVDELTSKAFPSDGSINPTLGYGIGNWYQQNGNTEKSNEIFLKILESPSWDAFGYIAAEAELTTAFPVPID